MIDFLEVALPTSETSSTIVLTTVSSDGFINLYDLADVQVAITATENNQEGGVEVEPIGNFDTDKSRLTCVCAIGLVDRGGDAGKAGGEDGNGSEDEEDDEDDEEDDEDEDGEGESEEEFEGFGDEQEDEDEEEEEEED
jgi:protein MAK11